MTARRPTPFQVAATVAPLLAVAPLVLGSRGGIWTAMHLIGGALSLVFLGVAAFRLPNPWRWWAIAGVVISIAVIAVVTDGGSIAAPVQVATLVVLAAIYISCVFWPHHAK